MNQKKYASKRRHLFVDSSDVNSFQFKLFQISTSIMLLIGLAVCAITLLRHFYYGDPWIGIFSFKSDDMPGYAVIDPDKHLFGIHYFGDYLLASYWSELSNPWLADTPVNYPPLALLFFRMFTVFSYKLGLTLFQLTMFICMVAPIWMSLKERALITRVNSVIIFGLISGPIIMSIDRGNIIGYLGILCYLFAVCVLNKKWYLAAVCVSIAVGIKLFPIVLMGVFVVYRKWGPLFVGLLSSALTVFVTLMIFPGSYKDSISGLWSGLSSFRNVESNLLYCGNTSLTGGLLDWLDRFGLQDLSRLVISNTLATGLLFSSLLFILMIKFRTEVWLVLVLSMSTITAAPALVYSYTMIWVVAAIAIMFYASDREIRDETLQSSAVSRTSKVQNLYFSTTIYLTILLIPYPIRWNFKMNLDCMTGIYPAVYFVATSVWVAYLYSFKLGKPQELLADKN
jgi:hypothetical protein